jgi:hypothetical protein
MNLRWVWILVLGAALCRPAAAATLAYGLDQANSGLPDGTVSVIVTIADGIGGSIVFTIATSPGAFAEGINFGVQSFGFNLAVGATPLSAANFLLPAGWTVASSKKQNGFGRFDWVVSGSGGSRLDPLVFSILGIADDTPASYFDLSGAPASEGQVAFAAHVAGFVPPSGSGPTSAYFGGSTPVPLPAAAWLLGSGLIGLLGMARARFRRTARMAWRSRRQPHSRPSTTGSVRA